MGRPGKQVEQTKPPETQGKAPGSVRNKSPTPRDDDDELYEDGDISTPKRDRYGPDDEPV